METMRDAHTGLGAQLRIAREAKGLSKQGLARELSFPVHLIEALEAEDWDRIPPGRERPLLRRMADRLAVDLESCPELWDEVPGSPEAAEAPDPQQERLERIFTGLLTLASALVLLWLVVPGRGLRGQHSPQDTPNRTAGSEAWSAPTQGGAYPVLGEVLPEAPVNEEGILVILRSLDACEALIQSEGGELRHSLRTSEPWRLRVKGAFTLTLENAGVVSVEVAGRKLRHGRNVGEGWLGRFDAQGLFQPPQETQEPPVAPESEGEEGGEET